MTLQKQILKDTDGNDIGIFMPMQDYKAIMKMLEDMEDVRDFDAAKESEDEAIPFEQAINEIELQRNDL
jgi:hypothetical protein